MSRRAREHGFTLVELTMVILVLSVLVRLSLPAYANMRRDAIASQAAGDLNVVRAAALAQFEATGSYPPAAPSGCIPAGMGPFLPDRFSFVRRDYDLAWENFEVSDPGTAGATGMIVALTVIPKDPATGLRVISVLGANCSHWSVGDAHTFVIFSTLDAPR
jgi:prepilin-type N-terminal cleavage/methylation domain-containing protein